MPYCDASSACTSEAVRFVPRTGGTIVAAESEKAALRAVKAIKVTYQVLEPVLAS